MDVNKLMRMQSMLGAVLAEVRTTPAESPASRTIAEATRRAVIEVGSALSETDLDELATLIGGLDRPLTLGESRVVDAQLLGWLDGLALQHHWETARAGMQAELRRARDARAEATLEDRRRARGAF